MDKDISDAISVMNKKQLAIAELVKAISAGRTLIVNPDWSVEELKGTMRQVTTRVEGSGKKAKTVIRTDTAPKTKTIVGAGVVNVDETVPLFTPDAWTEFLPGSKKKTAEQAYKLKLRKQLEKKWRLACEMGLIDEPEKKISFRYGPISMYSLGQSVFLVDSELRIVNIVFDGIGLIDGTEFVPEGLATSTIKITNSIPVKIELPAKPKEADKLPEPQEALVKFRPTAQILRALSPNTLFRLEKDVNELDGICQVIYIHTEMRVAVGFKFKGDDKKFKDASQFFLEFEKVYEKPDEATESIVEANKKVHLSRAHANHLRDLPKYLRRAIQWQLKSYSDFANKGA